jgi:hypothetical protein
MENTASLSVWRCYEDEHVPAMEVLLTSDGTIEFQEPFDDELSGYYEMGYEFKSLGRAAVIEPHVRLTFRFVSRAGLKIRNEIPQNITLSSLRTDGSAHVRLWIAPEWLLNVEVVWEKSGATHVWKGDRIPLDFHPMDPERPEYRAVRALQMSGDALLPLGQPTTIAPPGVPRPDTVPQADANPGSFETNNG